MKNFNDYQDFTIKTAFFTGDHNIDYLTYLTICLSGEVGELANWVKKVYRDKNGFIDEDDVKHIASELGDILWYLSVFAKKIGYSLDDIAEINKSKIENRIEKGTQRGSGDDR